MIFDRLLFPLPPRENAGGDGAGAPPAQGAGGAPPPAPTQSSPEQAPQGAPANGQQWAPPAWAPDRLKADNRDGFYQNLERDWQAQHQKLSGLPQPGKTAADYTYTPSEKAKPFFANPAEDKVFQAAQSAAHAAGIPTESFQRFVGAIFEGMIDQNLLVAPPDVHAERLEFLGKTGSGMSADQAIAAIKPEVERLGLFVDGFAQQAGLDEKGKAALGTLLTTGAGLKALNALAKAAATPGLKPGGAGGADGGITRKDLQARQRDPRNDRDSGRYDPDFAKETQRLYREVVG